MTHRRSRHILLFGAALLAGAAPLPADAQTLRYDDARVWPRGSADTYYRSSNPYQLRRDRIRARQKAGTTVANIPSSPPPAPVLRAEAPRRPLRVVIPNLAASRQQESPQPILAESIPELAPLPATPETKTSGIQAATQPPPPIEETPRTQAPPPEPIKLAEVSVMPRIVPTATEAAWLETPPAPPPDIPPLPDTPVTLAENSFFPLKMSAATGTTWLEALPAQPPETYSRRHDPVSPPGDAPASAPTVYHSPGLIIERQVERAAQQDETPPRAIAALTPTDLAALAPAAGDDDLTITPLINLPQTEVPRTSQAPDPAAATATPQMPPPLAGGDAATATLDKELASPAPASSEPAADVSGASKIVLEKIPSRLNGKESRKPEQIAIDRAKDTSSLSITGGEAMPESVKHEALGIKIEVKRPQINVDYELEKAYAAMVAGNSPAAIDIYRQVLSINPKNKDALFGLATSYHRAGQIEMARPLYARLLSIDPNHRDALNNFMALVADEAPEAALEQLAALEKRNPQFSPIPAQMAVIYQKLGDTDKATQKMFRAVALAPENLTYRYNLAIILDKQKNYEEAARLYRQLLEARNRGETIPGNARNIQERLTFISSNRR